MVSVFAPLVGNCVDVKEDILSDKSACISLHLVQNLNDTTSAN